MTDKELIDALGGTAKVAALLEVKKPVVGNWRIRGISWSHRARIAVLARRRRIALPLDFLTGEYKKRQVVNKCERVAQN